MKKNVSFLRILITGVICLAATVVFFACGKDDAKQIINFSFNSPQATGIINESAGTIAVTLPTGTNVTALVPTIKISDLAKVSPASGVAQDFSSPVTYKVTAEDGSTAIYIVTVTLSGTPDPDPDPDPTGDPIELTSPITADKVLKDLGLAVDYIFKGNDFLEVQNTAVLTIEPGVTIKFTNTGKKGGIKITSSATIKAVGTASKRIQFIGAVEAAGSWQGIQIESNTDNQFAYCDFLNMGNSVSINFGQGGLQLQNAKVGITYCKFTNGLGTGIRAGSNAVGYSQFSAFNNNVFEGYENYPPVILETYQSLSMLEKFDMTSDFTNNAKKYIQINPHLTKEVTINKTTVPYYFTDEIYHVDHNLTINEGVTIYMNNGISLNDNSRIHTGRLTINGTASNKVKFTRLPGTSGYWRGIMLRGLFGSVINHCVFEYGGGIFGANYCGIITIFSDCDVSLNNVELRNAQAYGVRFYNCDGYTLTHNNVTFFNNEIANVHEDCTDKDLNDLP